MLLTIDSSTFVASLRPSEPHHVPSRRLVALVEADVHQAILPLTVLVEVVASLRRRTGSELLARRAERDLRGFAGVRFEPVSEERAMAAVRIASTIGLRGMDAIVVQVAQELGATLVTLDAEMAQRAAGVVTVRDVAGF